MVDNVFIKCQVNDEFSEPLLCGDSENTIFLNFFCVFGSG